jgi:hypothetical protein
MPFQELKKVCFICNSRVFEDELVPKLPLTVPRYVKKVNHNYFESDSLLS